MTCIDDAVRGHDFVQVLLSGVAMVLLVYGPLILNYCTCFRINKN
jgi:hypothetical protein